MNLASRMIRLLLIVLILPCWLPAAATTLSGTGYDWDGRAFAVPLEIKDNSGVARKAWPVTSGIPLPLGLVRQTSALRLTNARGEEIPCQITPLARYGSQDNSLRWVLLDFQTDLPANGRTTVYLRNDRPAASLPSIMAVRDTGDSLVVDTGPLAVRVDKRSGTLIKSVDLAGRRILEAGRDDGPVLRSAEVDSWEHFTGSKWNTHGWDHARSDATRHIAEAAYRSAYGRPPWIEVEMQGPLRTVITLRGTHVARGRGDGLVAEGMYHYTTRLHFFRGKHYMQVEHTVENSSRQSPQWMYPFHAAGLQHSLALGDTITVTTGGQASTAGPTARSFPATTGQAGWLYQYPSATAPRKTQGPTFQAGIHDGSAYTVIAQGSQARYLDISDARHGVAAMVRYGWQEAPRALSGNGKSLNIWLHADSPAPATQDAATRPVYDLDFGERSSHDVLLYFHEGNAAEAGVAEVAEAFEYPLFARAPSAWYSDTDTWYFEVARDSSRINWGRQGSDAHWQPDRTGWRSHGAVRDYNSGGHHESLSSSWLPYVALGHLSDLERLLAQSRWSILHNPGWAYLDNVMRGSGTGVDTFLSDWDRLTGFGTKDFYLWRRQGAHGKAAGGETYLNGYKVLPDIEHYALFRIFEYYYLTGDRRALDAINGFVDWAVNYQHKHIFQREMQPLDVTDLFERDPDALRRGHYSRIYAWMLYTTLAGYQATGSPVFNEFAIWQLRRALALLRHRHGKLSRWDTNLGDLFPTLQGNRLVERADALLKGHELANWDSRMRTLLGWFGNDTPAASKDKTWMEAKGVFALHEAYRTYGDERILDGLWGMADYFSHHVVHYPRSGMINQHTGMPNLLLGTSADSLSPQRHDRVTQAWPLLYHYTGWPATLARYQRFAASASAGSLAPRFQQTAAWEQVNKARHSTRPAAPITDLRVIKASRGGLTLAWTSPRDDSPNGRASRYFVKYSDKPIVEFAPTDNPMREPEKQRIIRQVEENLRARPRGDPAAGIPAEQRPEQLHHPRWDQLSAFWMAEHVAGEPIPGPAGKREVLTVRELRPHNWLGAPRQPGLEILEPGRDYYFAICTWDEDRNLSKISNVVKVRLP